jgi:glycosyltransferase 2 family protein
VRGLGSPRRLALLFGGNVASEVLFATVLGMFVAALGYPVGIGELLLTNIGVGLLAGLLPVPGGIGVAEGGLTLGLVQAGVPEEAAFAAVLLYRMATFYLPPIWGYVAMRWLERNEHL